MRDGSSGGRLTAPLAAPLTLTPALPVTRLPFCSARLPRFLPPDGEDGEVGGECEAQLWHRPHRAGQCRHAGSDRGELRQSSWHSLAQPGSVYCTCSAPATAAGSCGTGVRAWSRGRMHVAAAAASCCSCCACDHGTRPKAPTAAHLPLPPLPPVPVPAVRLLWSHDPAAHGGQRQHTRVHAAGHPGARPAGSCRAHVPPSAAWGPASSSYSICASACF